jgi:hypothetical protein
MSRQAETRYPHAQRTAARVGGALLLTGGLLAVVLMFIGPGFVHGKTEITLVIAACAIIAGGFCISGRSARYSSRCPRS